MSKLSEMLDPADRVGTIRERTTSERIAFWLLVVSISIVIYQGSRIWYLLPAGADFYFHGTSGQVYHVIDSMDGDAHEAMDALQHYLRDPNSLPSRWTVVVPETLSNVEKSIEDVREKRRGMDRVHNFVVRYEARQNMIGLGGLFALLAVGVFIWGKLRPNRRKSRS